MTAAEKLISPTVYFVVCVGDCWFCSSHSLPGAYRPAAHVTVYHSCGAYYARTVVSLYYLSLIKLDLTLKSKDFTGFLNENIL